MLNHVDWKFDSSECFILKAAGTLESDCWNVGGRERPVVIIKMSIIRGSHLTLSYGEVSPPGDLAGLKTF